jgi:hypothetical protein
MKTISNLMSVSAACLIFASACATVSPEEFKRFSKKVRVIGSAPASCKEIGSFDGNGGGEGLSYAKDILRYKIGKAGGNAVVFDYSTTTTMGAVANTTVSGMGYKCP